MPGVISTKDLNDCTNDSLRIIFGIVFSALWANDGHVSASIVDMTSDERSPVNGHISWRVVTLVILALREEKRPTGFSYPLSIIST